MAASANGRVAWWRSDDTSSGHTNFLHATVRDHTTAILWSFDRNAHTAWRNGDLAEEYRDGDLPNDAIPKDAIGFDATGKPKAWPMRLAKVHWAALLPGLPSGEYVLRCRTIDAKGDPKGTTYRVVATDASKRLAADDQLRNAYLGF